MKRVLLLDGSDLVSALVPLLRTVLFLLRTVLFLLTVLFCPAAVSIAVVGDRE